MMAEAMFGAGCFWGVEEVFRTMPGVTETAVGYSGGTVENPTYEQVCQGSTEHAEVLWLRFDPERVSYQALLNHFFENHDPTTLNRQGPDVGSQYRSAIYFYDTEQSTTAEKVIAELTASGRFDRAIVTEVLPAGPFYRAEEYHQRYFERRGGGGCHI